MTLMTVKGNKVKIEIIGSGEPLVLLHGFPLDHSIWLKEAELLQNDFQLIIPDLPGFGESEPLAGDGKMDGYCLWLKDILDELGLSSVNIVGHSMGGYIALQFLWMFPGMVKGIGLVASQAFADTDENRTRRLGQIEDLKKQGISAVVGMASRLTEDTCYEEQLSQLIMRQNIPGAIFALQAMASRQDHSALVRNTAKKVVLIHGDKDELIPLQKSELLKEQSPTTTLIVLNGIGHTPMLEDSIALAKALMVFKEK